MTATISISADSNISFASEHTEILGYNVPILSCVLGLLSQIFVQNIKNQKAELAELEQEVDEMKVYLKKRVSNKDRIIERRINELCGTEEDLGW